MFLPALAGAVAVLCCNLPPERLEECFNDHDCQAGHACEAGRCVWDVCGNGELDDGEDCDFRAPHLTRPCNSFDYRYTSGRPRCTSECGVDLTSCGPKDCSDGVISGAELCDLLVRPERPCSEVNKCMKSGVARCREAGCTWDLSACTPVDTCGNGLLDSCDACDPTAKSEWPCRELGDEWVGRVRCREDCTIDRTGCRQAPVCGDGVREADQGEECDDGNTEPGDGCSPVCREEWDALLKRPLEPPLPGDGPDDSPFGFESPCFPKDEGTLPEDPTSFGIRVLAKWVVPPGELETDWHSIIETLLVDEVNMLLAEHRVRLAWPEVEDVPLEDEAGSGVDLWVRELLEDVPEGEANKLRIVFAPITYGGMFARRGGIAINPDVPPTYLRRVVAHQIGHYVGLPHTHACPSGAVPSLERCNETGDFLCSTPPDPGLREARDSCYGRLAAGEMAESPDVCEFDDGECQVTCTGDATPDIGNVMSGYPVDGARGYECEDPSFNDEQGWIMRCVLRNELASVAFVDCPAGILPRAETCDGQDEDCDGQIDQGAQDCGELVCEEGECVRAEDDDLEPNNTQEDARDVGAGSYLDLRVWGDDEDWFSVRVGHRQHLTAVVRFAHADGDVELVLRGADGEVLQTSKSTTDQESVEYAHHGAGELELYLRVYLGSRESNRYDLDVQVEDLECLDTDGDGYGRGCELGVDCNEGSPAAHVNASEVCDRLDNDCDGETDEGDPGGGGECETDLEAPCAAGVAHCRSGVVVCEPHVEPAPEVCDGLDNDCDGAVDNGDPGGGAECDTGGYGACAEGTMHCVDGRLACVRDAEPAPEVCDGRDNDCDGHTDDGCHGCPEGMDVPLGWSCAVGSGAGGFEMGTSPDGEPWGLPDEARHRVVITRPFLVKRTEVTQAEWEAVMGSNPSWFREGPAQDCAVDSCDSRPVEMVSWYDAMAFLNRLSGAEGLDPCYGLADCSHEEDVGGGCDDGALGCAGSYACADVTFAGLDCTGYRLPTEAEWEYAARAGSVTAFHTGETSTGGCEHDAALDEAGWYCGNAGDRTHPVAEKAANAWGLYDVHGNVSEWVWDRYAEDYYQDWQVDPTGADEGGARAFRGGSWHGPTAICRAASRFSAAPIDRRFMRGLRPVRSVPQQPR